jgi:hypothetical protein
MAILAPLVIEGGGVGREAREESIEALESCMVLDLRDFAVFIA